MKSKPVTLCLEETDCYAGGRGEQELSGREGSSSEPPHSALPSSVEVLPSPLPHHPPWALISCAHVAAILLGSCLSALPKPPCPSLPDQPLKVVPFSRLLCYRTSHDSLFLT